MMISLGKGIALQKWIGKARQSARRGLYRLFVRSSCWGLGRDSVHGCSVPREVGISSAVIEYRDGKRGEWLSAFCCSSCPVSTSVAMSDVAWVKLPEDQRRYRTCTNEIGRKHVDFLLCDPAATQPHLGSAAGLQRRRYGT